jgi:DNA-binding CsgD family transcriptional regulator
MQTTLDQIDKLPKPHKTELAGIVEDVARLIENNNPESWTVLRQRVKHLGGRVQIPAALNDFVIAGPDGSGWGMHRLNDWPETSAKWRKAALESLDVMRVRLGQRAKRRNTPPLTEREREVYDLLAALRPGQALTGKQIKQKTGIDQSTLTSHIIPKLKLHGVKNRRGVGYYLSEQ